MITPPLCIVHTFYFECVLSESTCQRSNPGGATATQGLPHVAGSSCARVGGVISHRHFLLQPKRGECRHAILGGTSTGWRSGLRDRGCRNVCSSGGLHKSKNSQQMGGLGRVDCSYSGFFAFVITALLTFAILIEMHKPIANDDNDHVSFFSSNLRSEVWAFPPLLLANGAASLCWLALGNQRRLRLRPSHLHRMV